MYCNHCGTEIDQDSKYCRHCGQLSNSEVFEKKTREPINVKKTLETLYFGCVTAIVSLFILLAGSAIQPWPELTEIQNSVLFGTVFASIFTTASIFLEKRLLVISDGMMTAGLFSLGLSIVANLLYNTNQFTFWIITIGMVTTLYTGYIKFVKSQLVATET